MSHSIASKHSKTYWQTSWLSMWKCMAIIARPETSMADFETFQEMIVPKSRCRPINELLELLSAVRYCVKAL
jgi:hypothetical protein